MIRGAMLTLLRLLSSPVPELPDGSANGGLLSNLLAPFEFGLGGE
jgi:hypothetical protein